MEGWSFGIAIDRLRAFGWWYDENGKIRSYEMVKCKGLTTSSMETD